MAIHSKLGKAVTPDAAIPATSTLSSSIKFLLSPVKVEGVINTINKQVNIVTFEVYNSLNTMVNQVVSGVWKGDGADRFVEEMKSLVYPQIMKLWSSISLLGGQLIRAMETMQSADNQAGKVASKLMDEFKGIYH